MHSHCNATTITIHSKISQRAKIEFDKLTRKKWPKIQSQQVLVSVTGRKEASRLFFVYCRYPIADSCVPFHFQQCHVQQLAIHPTTIVFDFRSLNAVDVLSLVSSIIEVKEWWTIQLNQRLSHLCPSPSTALYCTIQCTVSVSI